MNFSRILKSDNQIMKTSPRGDLDACEVVRFGVHVRDFENFQARGGHGFLTLKPLHFNSRMRYQNIKSANSIFKSFVISWFRVPLHSCFIINGQFGHTKCLIWYVPYDIDHMVWSIPYGPYQSPYFEAVGSSINGTLFSEVILLFFPFLVVKLKIRW